jgi:O-acetylserine/cysteine efflux transporter
VLWLPRRKISWPALIAIGLTVFTGRFLLQFFDIAGGMPAGLTAVVVQTQALFTVLFVALVGDTKRAGVAAAPGTELRQ